MNEETRSTFSWILRLLSASVSAGALVMFFYILSKAGIVPPGQITGPNKAYEQGWALFFFLVFGIPCLVLFVAGLAPLLLWRRDRRNPRKVRRASSQSKD